MKKIREKQMTTPLENLERRYSQDMDSVPKLQAHKGTTLSGFFNVGFQEICKQLFLLQAFHLVLKRYGRVERRTRDLDLPAHKKLPMKNRLLLRGNEVLNCFEGIKYCAQSEQISYCYLTTSYGFAAAVIGKAKWNSSRVRDKIKRGVDAHITEVRCAKLAEVTTL
ncbi:hypothetical protein CQW23_15056 [Capsicum baccatum]|uniref:Uncharacterized protein n=1 Tax=Capsicum baccatum TaxID=33114 RepID=A0A2G2WKY8_CAPBA|nr:hypothetical protein CQW23_15056 [Capsicum baccatum]